MSAPRRLVLLGSTGSIGTQALDVIASAGERFEVVALCAGGRDLDAFAAQIATVRPRHVGVARSGAAPELRERVAARWRTREALPEIVDGPQAPTELAQVDCDTVLNGIAGDQGLRATLAALGAGHTVALANKESLIAGGPLVLDAAKPGQLVPVDSEHSALAQALRGGRPDEVRRLVVTASGGPFRGWRRPQMADVTPAQALAHPTWSMGPLVTINSATLVNKGLEVIEAHLLFGVAYADIEVVVHPQSVVHSMVEFVDGSTLAQASPPDMRLPISLALGWPDRVAGVGRPLDWTQRAHWDFEPLDRAAFPCVDVAYEAGRAGGCAPAVFNAANEEFVAAFLDGRCGYLDLTDGLAAVLERWLGDQHAAAGNPGTVDEVEAAQDWARRRAGERVAAARRAER